MPTQIVDVDLQSETGAISQQTYSDLLIVARNPSTEDPTTNDPLVFDSATQVASEFGENSDAYIASEMVESMGVRNWWVLMLDTEEHTEIVGNSDEESVNEGTVQNTPMRGGDNVSVTLDGEDQDVVYAASSPPERPDSGEAAVNTETGTVVTGDNADGTGAGIEVEYETLSWSEARPEMDAGDFDLTILADTRADHSYLGEAGELVTWSESDNASMVIAYENGNNFESEDEAVAQAHEFGGYLPSGSLLPIAHKSSDDVAAGVAGRLATKEPWFNPFMDGNADYSFAMDQYRRSLIGNPDSPGTFEGGDENGSGPCNVLYREMGSQILSNSLSTAGADSNYQFFDVKRTENFVISEVERALNGLRLTRDQIPFAPIGRSIIESALRERLNQYVASSGRALSPEELAQQVVQAQEGDQDAAFSLQENRRTIRDQSNVPLSELEINVPRYDDLDQTDRANRVWSGIQVTAQLAGNVHTFDVELAVQV